MNSEEYYIFNPSYFLKNDKNRIIIGSNGNRFSIISDSSVNNNFINYVHPIHAILFSFFNGKKLLKNIVEEVSLMFNITEDNAYNIIKPFIENKNELVVIFKNIPISFPKNVLIRNTELIERNFNFNDFNIPSDKLDLYELRVNYPIDVILMINNICKTDCIYCYADRKNKMNCQLSFDRIREIIKEARNIGMRQFDISGGEIFLYDKWDKLIKELIINDFYPYLSTKLPIDEDTIIKLKEIRAKDLQISLDSIIEEELVKILKVEKGYLKKIINTIENLDKHGINIYINTILTKYNSNLDNIKKLLNFLFGLKNIRKISIGAGGYSIYKGLNSFLDYKTKITDLEKIKEYVENVKENLKNEISLTFGGYPSKEEFLGNSEKKKEKFDKRALCTGNIECFYILPDGKVTICEELYWHPNFIIGDISKNSIMEVWNSERAKNLYNLTKENLQNKSICKECDEFFPCRKIPGICWKEVLYAYGEDNWDYPDPKCPKAPIPYNEYFIV